ncbi:MAG: hypothetical protein ACI9W2_003119 [Gammaproteobacteria bacterium]|jgi:hypothetical protein
MCHEHSINAWARTRYPRLHTTTMRLAGKALDHIGARRIQKRHCRQIDDQDFMDIGAVFGRMMNSGKIKQ